MKNYNDKEQRYRTERMVRAMVECNRLTEGCLTTTQVARRMKMTARELYRWLHRRGILFRNSGLWMLAPRYTGLDLLRYRYLMYYTLEGEEKTRAYPVWTPRGEEFLMEMKGMMEMKEMK